MKLLAQMGLIALVIGTSLTSAATERIDLQLVLAGTAGWAFVPVLQLLTGLVLVRGARGGARTALEAYFGTHWIWSAWILAVHGVVVAVDAVRPYQLLLIVTAVIPAVFTVRALLRLARDEYGFDARTARRRVAQQQALTVLLIVLYADQAVALVPRVFTVLAR